MEDLARIAKVLEGGNLVINRGEAHKVAAGQRFLVFEQGEEIIDPETGESLGRLEIVKGHAEVVHVQEKLSVLRVLRPDQERSKTLSELMATLSGSEEQKLPPPKPGDYARRQT